MLTTTRTVLAVACMLFGHLGHAQTAPRTVACATPAVAQASKLLAFHIGPDERIAIDPNAKALAPIPNPAAAKEKLAVVEVWGNVYKGRYRMRFLFAGSGPTACTLMGQEILEYAKL